MDVLDEVSFDVERGKVREFALATRAADPVHVDRAAAGAAGFPDVPATATHVVAAGHFRDQLAFVAKLGLAFERVVVGSVKWTYFRPLCAGDSVHGVRRVADDTPKRGMRFVTLETDYLDASGECAVRVREVLIERSAQ
ncbi:MULTISPECIES: MaoC family dehydratase N-terminal domain-containing protein [unclassified Amycolatopsis]|uniref:FAS1-like dehydratase domain-containing protein n=1 Tax=unclassified Amycolatopsis TaxID=2618356 RepID=UPI00106E8DCF|nr:MULTISPECIES: MaoC family dehydratase N-terminal domain-containing protein [unclassified Amycolatopsis]